VGSISSERITALLVEWKQGNQQAAATLMPLVYDELRRIASRYLRRKVRNQTIHSGTLVHEAYLKLVDQKDVHWQNRAHFFGLAAQLMRRILVDHARRRAAVKRGAGEHSLSLDATGIVAGRQPVELIARDELLNRLSELNPQQAQIVELRFFGGLSIEEASEAIGISPATLKREWAVAKAWLHRELRGTTRADT